MKRVGQIKRRRDINILLARGSGQLGRDKQTETWEMRRVAAKFIRMLYNPDGISTQSVKLFNLLLQPYVLNKL